MKKAAGTVILLSTLAILLCAGRGYGQSGVFDRTGVIPGHGFYSSLPEESVDLFTGNVILRYLDYRLPGPNGLDVEIWRVYNSKILADQSGSVQADHKSWVGIGWTMHMGRVHNYNTTTPIIEFPDGRWETTYPDRYENPTLKKNVTRDFLRYDREGYKLYFQNGVTWTFGVVRTITRADGTTEAVRLVNLIQNSYGHSITILYDSGKPSIDKITDSMGRVIDFISTGTTYKKLASIKVKTATGSYVYYNYNVGEFPNGYHKLVSFTPPLLPPATYDYLDGTNNQYELTKVTTSNGGLLEYSYSARLFYFGFTSLNSRVVIQKKITFNPDEQAKIWSFTYPDYYGTPTGTATVEGPEFSTSVASHAYDVSCPWKIGLISSKTVSDGSLSESYEWTYQQVSNSVWFVLGTDMGTAKGPLLSSVNRVPLGDAANMTEYLFEREETKRYGLPTRINKYYNSATNPKNYIELTYFYEASTGFKDRYLIAYISDEIARAEGGAMLKRTSTSYFQEAGKWGAIDEVRKYTTESNYHVWNYSYTSSNPNSIKITIDPPGEFESQEINYSYGVQNGLIYSGGVEKFARVISQYDSSVSSEENQHGGKLVFTYDGSGRITYIERLPKTPTQFNDTSLTWRPNSENKVVITQGGNVITMYWDGVGRDTGSTETGGDTTLYNLRILDAEGRLKEQSAGSTNPAHRFVYFFNNADQITRLTDPLQKVTNIAYSGTRMIVTDPENRVTTYDYEDLSGKPTKVTDALGRESVYTYDALGRLIGVNFNGERPHTYVYDWLDNVLSESHPETGSIGYSFNNPELKLDAKTWGTTEQKYYYNEAGQLSKIETYKSGDLEESITYGNDLNGRLSYVSGSSGWSRTNITYNIWGSVKGETVTISGLAPKSMSYGYDGNNNQSSIAYPDGRTTTTNYNTLNMPQTIAFSGKTIVDNVTYGPYRMPTNISIAGNGTNYSATYSSSGLLSTVSLSKGASSLYNASYTYDGAGNIIGISGTSPAPALNATFGYDALNRLTSATYSTGRVNNYAYEYDAHGNMTVVRENGIPLPEKSYDSQNRIIGLSYDERGNLLSWEGKSYQWDSQNRLRYILSLSGEVLGQYLYDDRGLRLRAVPPYPEINVKQDGTTIPDGGSFFFKTVVQQDKIFTVENLGNKNLVLGELMISGQDADSFDVIQQPSSPVTPASNTTFIIRFNPQSGGLKIATLALTNDDLDENPYNFFLYGNYVPEINVYGYPNGSSYDFGTVGIGYSGYMSFTIENLGTAPLTVTAGTDSPFGIEQQPSSPVQPGGHTDVIVRFSPMSEGPLSGCLSISSDDSDENPYVITLYGTGQIGPMKIDGIKGKIILAFPSGDERLLAGTVQTIIWSAGEELEFVKIEYSTNNGSTYRTIANQVLNNGRYDWVVPSDISSNCLIRITESEGRPLIAPEMISFGFTFKVSDPQAPYVPVSRLSVNMGVPNYLMESYNSLNLEFVPYESGESVRIGANSMWYEPRAYDVFLDMRHRINVQFEMNSRVATIWMDNEVLYANVPLNVGPITASYGTISISSNANANSGIWIDDVEVKVSDPENDFHNQDSEHATQWKRLFLDDFENYGSSGELLGYGGWVKPIKSGILSTNESDREKGDSPLRHLLKQYWNPNIELSDMNNLDIDQNDSISGLCSLKINKFNNEETQIIKIFSLPAISPFDISQRSFMVINRNKDTIKNRVSRVIRRSDLASPTSGLNSNKRSVTSRGLSGKSHIGNTVQAGQKSSAEVRLFSAYPTGTYYLYAFDGRLLAEYNDVGFCTRDYIYVGDKLIAEYRPQEDKYFYYTADHINSTRIVTDDLGTVVYAAAHDPYGGIQKTWEPITFDPSLKFSGKERDLESGLDYFGARYYDKSLYRFISTDPTSDIAYSTTDPQLWNLYSYCRSNPIGYVDVNGCFGLVFHIDIIRVEFGAPIPSKYKVMYRGPGYTAPPTFSIRIIENQLVFFVNFEVYLWDDKAMDHYGKDYEKTRQREVAGHCGFIYFWVMSRAENIEKKWKKESLKDEAKALANAEKRFGRLLIWGRVLSNLLLDWEINDFYKRLWFEWGDIHENWIPWEGDTFMIWIFFGPWAFSPFAQAFGFAI